MKRRSLIFGLGLLTLAVSVGVWHFHRPAVVTAPSATLDLSPWAPLFDSSVPMLERHALARSVNASLPLEEIGNWVSGIEPHDTSEATEAHCVIYNELVEQIRQRNLFPTTFTSFLIAALQNGALHPTVRDYAAQHLALWLSNVTPSQSAEIDPARQAQGLSALCAIVRDASVRHESIPGTALLALADMAQNRAADLTTVWPQLDASLAALITDAEAPPTLRISAVQAAAMAGRTAHLPAIRQLASTPSAPSAPEPLLISAIAALGTLGDASDRPLLVTLTQFGSLASQAATAALKRLPL